MINKSLASVKVSVVMATYNGSTFLKEQLESIHSQTRLPDEVIICDDRSTDETARILNTFINSNELKNWCVFVNSKNLGWKRNFRKAISLATGDLIFFSDQDDIWYPNKIEYMSNLMLQHDMGCLYGESIKINACGDEINELNSINSFDGKLELIPYSKSFYTAGGLGCCMSISRQIAKKYLNLNVLSDDHDSQCPRIALLYDTLWHINEPVIKYRIYSGNTSGISNQYSYGTSNLDQRIKDIKTIYDWMKVVCLDPLVDKKKLLDVKKIMHFLEKRLRYLQGSKIIFPYLLLEYKYYSGLSMLIGDFSYRHGLNRKMGKVRWKIKKMFVKAHNK